jgi:hypothetical protein
MRLEHLFEEDFSEDDAVQLKLLKRYFENKGLKVIFFGDNQWISGTSDEVYLGSEKSTQGRTHNYVYSFIITVGKSLNHEKRRFMWYVSGGTVDIETGELRRLGEEYDIHWCDDDDELRPLIDSLFKAWAEFPKKPVKEAS